MGLLRILAWIIGAIVVIYLGAMIYFWPGDLPPVAYDKVDTKVIDLSYGNGLAGDNKDRFYHTSQGAEIFPIRMLRALTDPKTGKPFMEDLERFGLMPDPKRDDGLAVGLTLARNDFTAGLEMVGITCSACHTGEFRYNGKGVRVDGAPNMFDMQTFYADMFGAVVALKDNGELRRQFLERLFQQAYGEYGWLAPVIRPAVLLGQAVGLLTHIDELKARASLAKVIAKAVERRNAKPECQGPKAQCTSGFGRLDAFNGTRNFILAQLSDDNLVELNAPSKFPPVWNFKDYRWVEWTQNTNSVMERNFTETMGAGATVKLLPDQGDERFTSSIPVRNMRELEVLSYNITPPKWPEQVFGKIDPALAGQGKAIYDATCARCHEYGASDYTDTGLLELRRYAPGLETPIPGVPSVGTDAGAALTVACPVPNPGDLPQVAGFKKRQYSAEDATLLKDCKGVTAGQPFEGYAFATVVAAAVKAVMDKAVIADNVSESELREYEDLDRRGKIYWRDTVLPDGGDDAKPYLGDGKPYAARPLYGTWAAAPYLHNGSVPTLADLLEKANDRPKEFPLGQRDYDPVRVGFQIDLPRDQWKYTVKTSETGNGNGGHEYGTDLSADDKRALLEYLKTK
ncbi:MAG: hypothetical protein KDC18_15550 [Alphaproteobacteria bacterium]|nr:hypothetical protein [Alphaproteobacteria bacterium]MCB9930095.1 hypothetical protein [Alphaproteobacteria bacterium]